MKATLLAMGAGLAALLVSADGTGGGPNRPYVFVEQSHRLPPDAEPPGTSSTGVNLVDVDGDGDLDLFLPAGTAGLDPRPNQLYLNDGAGHFTDASATHLPPGLANSTKADFADIDGDGDLDAIVANVGPEQLLVNDGTGHFADASGQLPPPKPIFEDISANAQLADVDGDGCVDALISNENPFDPSPIHGAQSFLWINTRAGGRCTGVFVDQTAARLPAATHQTASMLAGDLDGDGDLDLVVLNRGQERVLVNNGAGVFEDQTAARFPVTTDSTRGGALADLDRDGALDLVTSNSRGQPPRVYWNDGRGAFTLGDFGFLPAPDQTDTELVLADLNHDHRPDVYIANAGQFVASHGFLGGPDHFFEARHGRTFADVSKLRFDVALQASTAAAFGDLDGDRDLDLVVAGTGDGEVGRERIFIQQRPGAGPGGGPGARDDGDDGGGGCN